jgi:hypothetical protein
MVRCGICRVTFNASWNLVDQLPGVELPPAVVHPRAAEPDVMVTDAPTTHDVSLEAHPEPVISEQATEPVEPGSAATSASVDAAASEVVSEAIEFETESIDVSSESQPEPVISEQATEPVQPESAAISASVDAGASELGSGPIDFESESIDVSPELQPEPVISEQATEPVEPESAAISASVDAEASEVVSEAIELESESILKEVEQLDNALSRKQGYSQRTNYQQTTDVDLTKKEYEQEIIPDDEIVLETPADAWQSWSPAMRAQSSAQDDERISTSVDQMRAMLNPVTEPDTDAEEQNTAAPAVEPSVAKKRGWRRTELPPELDPLHDGGVEFAAGGADGSMLSELYSGPEVDNAATETGSSATAWRGIAWFVGIVILLLVTLWQIREYYLSDLAQVPAIRPVLSEFCQIAACEVPPRRDSRLIDLVGTNVETHPAVPGALRVVVSLINRAEYSQLPPLLEVTLSDRTGRVVGRRTYTPKDYVASIDDANLEPNVVSNVTIDLATPSDSAVGYEIQLIPD